MKFTGILVRPLSEQEDRDGRLIDPAGVKITDETVTIWRDFSHNVPEDVMGSGVVKRAEDGSLIVEGELSEQGKSFVVRDEAKLAIGVIVEKQALEKGAGSVIATSTLWQVGMTWEHQDPAQPAIRLLDEIG